MLLLSIYSELRMGGVCSETASDDEEYRIPPGEEYKHSQCTVRAPHQLSMEEEGKVTKASSIVRIFRVTTSC